MNSLLWFSARAYKNEVVNVAMTVRKHTKSIFQQQNLHTA